MTETPSPCWGYHVSAVPAGANRIVDTQDRERLRVGPRSWRMAVKLDQPARCHEAWLLDNFGPVRCASTEQLLEARDAKLAAMLTPTDPGWCVFLPGQPDADSVTHEDAMMLMRAGWVAWGPKQRRDALASLRATEESELAKTS